MVNSIFVWRFENWKLKSGICTVKCGILSLCIWFLSSIFVHIILCWIRSFTTFVLSWYWDILRDIWCLRSSRHQANQADWQKIQEVTSEKLSMFYSMQSILMAIQQGNAAYVMGCPKKHQLALTFMFKKQKCYDIFFFIFIIF